MVVNLEKRINDVRDDITKLDDIRAEIPRLEDKIKKDLSDLAKSIQSREGSSGDGFLNHLIAKFQTLDPEQYDTLADIHNRLKANPDKLILFEFINNKGSDYNSGDYYLGILEEDSHGLLFSSDSTNIYFPTKRFVNWQGEQSDLIGSSGSIGESTAHEFKWSPLMVGESMNIYIGSGEVWDYFMSVGKELKKTMRLALQVIGVRDVYSW